MRLISLQRMLGQAREAAVRFPLVLLSAAVAATCGMILVHHGDTIPAIRVLLAALLGLPLFTALGTTAERAHWSVANRVTVQGAVVLLLLAFWFFTGTWTDSMRLMRFAQMALLAHLAVAVLPFVGTSLERGFWQYNRILFLRYIIGVIFAAVLFAGLSIALFSIDKLFGVHIDSEWYGRLWVATALIFHPWFLLGGVPRDLYALDTNEEYPVVIKVFAQFILLPVVSVYLLILTAYLFRVLITRTWPSGWIGYLVSSVAVAGTLALLLVHPLRERNDSRWVATFGRWFFIALLPSIGMLLMAIWLRVHQYGFTEPRYFLAILALWLGGIAIYYGLAGTRNIRVIPFTLGILAAVTFVGPWSAYAVSRSSQLGRLRATLAKSGLLTDARLVRPAGEVAFDDRKEISAIVRYLLEMHGSKALGGISGDLVRAADNPPPRAPDQMGIDDPKARAVVEQLGVSYVSRFDSRSPDRMARFYESGRHAIALEGFQYMTRAELTSPFTIVLDNDSLTFTPDSLPSRLIVTRGTERLLEVPTWRLVLMARERDSAAVANNTARATRPTPPNAQPTPRGRGASSPLVPDIPPLVLDAEGGGIRLRLVAHSVVGSGDSTRVRLMSGEAVVLVGKR